MIRAADPLAIDPLDLVSDAMQRRKPDPEAARRVAMGALLVARRAGNDRGETAALKTLGSVHLVLGQPRPPVRGEILPKAEHVILSQRCELLTERRDLAGHLLGFGAILRHLAPLVWAGGSL